METLWEADFPSLFLGVTGAFPRLHWSIST